MVLIERPVAILSNWQKLSENKSILILAKKAKTNNHRRFMCRHLDIAAELPQQNEMVGVHDEFSAA